MECDVCFVTQVVPRICYAQCTHTHQSARRYDAHLSEETLQTMASQNHCLNNVLLWCRILIWGSAYHGLYVVVVRYRWQPGTLKSHTTGTVTNNLSQAGCAFRLFQQSAGGKLGARRRGQSYYTVKTARLSKNLVRTKLGSADLPSALEICTAV